MRKVQTPEMVTVIAEIANNSDQPIRHIEVRWHRGSADYDDPNPELMAQSCPVLASIGYGTFRPSPTWP
jgi:hypothetical protein